MMEDEIRSLLEAPRTGVDAPTLDALEETLTAGYARALALEAERWRLERRIAALAATFGEESTESRRTELANLGRMLSASDGSLNQLRGLLSSLRTRASEVRATA
jgi:hypothetical protein